MEVMTVILPGGQVDNDIVQVGRCVVTMGCRMISISRWMVIGTPWSPKGEDSVLPVARKDGLKV